MKTFFEWFKIKTRIEKGGQKPPYFKEREIWWASIGENVGSEMDGKKEYFRRPVLVLKKWSKYSFLGVPLTSKEKEGSWYFPITHSGRVSRTVLSQMRYFDWRRLDKKMGKINVQEYDEALRVIVGLLLQK